MGHPLSSGKKTDAPEFCEHIKSNKHSLLWYTACPECGDGMPIPHRCMECGKGYKKGEEGEHVHWTGPAPVPVPDAAPPAGEAPPVKQDTIDESASPRVIHEGPYIQRGDTVRFTASEIETETEKAFCFVTKGDPEKWVPKSVCRVTKAQDGLIVDVCAWVE